MRMHAALSSSLILVVFLSGCSPLSWQNQTPSPVASPQSFFDLIPRPDPQQEEVEEHQDLVGRVIDRDGNPIEGATLESQNTTTTSDKDGWFRLPSQGLPQWIKVTSPGFISRTRASAPGIPVLFRLTSDDGKTIVIHFAGDTMFGRRFFDPNQDDYTADGLLPLEPTVDDHMRLLAPVKPLLENADFTVVNLESTLNDPAFFPKAEPRPAFYHPTTSSVYVSHPNSAIAMKQSGIDIVDMGNNHTYDMLEMGLNNSLSILDQAGVLHFGAGINEADAWTPVLISSKGQTIAILGCTTLRIPLQTPIIHDIPYVASDVLRKGGAAYCTEARLRTEIIKAKQQADIVIVMIHGGTEYNPAPTNKITYLAEIARQAGATLIINHQPHVIGGFSLRNQSLTAWTMGSFLSDQTIWPALKSYMLAVYLREGNIVGAYIEPLILDGFVPHGVIDEFADSVVRDAAGLKPGPFIMESGAMEVDLNSRALQNTYTKSVDGGSAPGEIIAIPPSQWVSGFQGTGKLLLGRDMLWVGRFENIEIDSASHVAPLWDLEMGSIRIGRDYAYEGETGIRLTRDVNDVHDAVTTNLHRVWVDRNTNLSITGMVRLNQDVASQIQLSWYSAASGPSFLKDVHPIEVQSYGDWQPFRLDVQVPSKAVALGLYLRLTPPEKGTVTVDFDNIRIIEWTDPRAQFSPLYNYALLIGSGDLTFAQDILPGAEYWLTSPLIDPNK